MAPAVANLRGFWVELPCPAAEYVQSSGSDRSSAGLAGRAQAELYLLRRAPFERHLARLARAGGELEVLARALRSQDLIRRGLSAEALPDLESLRAVRGEVGAWARLRGAEVLARLGRLDEARARLAESGETEPALLRALVEARLAQRAGRIEEADRILDAASGELPRAAAPLAATYHRARAILLTLCHDEPRALMHHRLAVDRLKEIGDRFLLAKEYLSLGQTYLESVELDIAEYFFQRAQTLVASLEGERLAGLLASRLGLLALTRGDLSAARSHFEKDLELATSAGLRHASAHARRNVGRVLVQAGDLAAGLPLLVRARAEFQALGDAANAMLAEVDEMAARGEAEPARLDAIDRFFQETARPELQARIRAVRAEILAAKGSVELANQELEEACRVFQRLRRPNWSLDATLVVAQRLEAGGHAEAALAHLRRAHAVALDAGLSGIVAVVVERIGRISERAVMELSGDDRGRVSRGLPAVGRRAWYQGTLERSRSAAVRALLVEAQAIAATDETVLVLGETGTGKELLARFIHEIGQRRDATFLAVNCGAIPDGLLESELFGHARGAFTGADRSRVGILEAADGGCAFLDEIGELSPRGQVTLLRFLEDRQVRPVGTNVARTVDVRLLAATNRDLLAEALAGRFRLDLYFRLAVFPLSIPPLRERRDDLPLLARTMLGHLPQAQRKGIQGIAPDALAQLHGRDWPGNLRELDNVLRAAAIRAEGKLIQARDLGSRSAARATATGAMPTLEEMERRHIVEALARTDGNQLRAAELLGIHRNTLAMRIRHHRIGEEGGRKRRR